MNTEAGQIDVSVVVVHWNVPSLLDGCLASIRAERDTSDLNIDVLVVDSCSDNLEHRTVVASHPGTGLVEMDANRGYGAACNLGILSTAGSAVLLLNPDTVILPGTIDKLWSTLNIAAHIGMVAPLLLNSDGSVQSAGYRFPGPSNLWFDLVPIHPRLYESRLNGRVPAGNGQLPLAIDYALGAAMLVRRESFDEVNGFDEEYVMYSEEVDFQRRLAEADWTRLLVPAARVTHIGGQSTRQRPTEMEEALWRSRVRYAARWCSSRDLKLLQIAGFAGTCVDSLRNPGNRQRNQMIREILTSDPGLE